MLTWKDRRDRYVNTLTRVAPCCRECRRKKGTSRANGEYVKVPRTEVKVSRGVPPGKNGCSPRSQRQNLAISHFLGHVEKKLAIFFLRFTQEAAKLVEKSCIFARAPPRDVVRRFPLGKVRKGGRLFA